MSEIPQLLLYTDAAKLQQRDLRALREAGIIPIRTTDIAAVSLISAKPPLVSTDTLLACALKALAMPAGLYIDKAQREFVQSLAASISTISSAKVQP